MSASKKRPGGKKVMMMKAMAKDAIKGGRPGKVAEKKGAPHHPKAVKALAAKSRAKQVAMTPNPGKAIAQIPKPSAAPRKKKITAK
jgi:hypothetical protein